MLASRDLDPRAAPQAGLVPNVAFAGAAWGEPAAFLSLGRLTVRCLCAAFSLGVCQRLSGYYEI